MWGALTALGASLAASLALTPLARLLARRWGFVAKPAADRWHQQPTAMMGGVAIAAATIIGLVAGLLVAGPEYRASLAVAWLPAVAVGGVSLFLLGVGLVDDRRHLRPQMKFTLQVLAGVALIAAGGVSIAPTPWYTVNVLITLFWFVGITNAFNLLDNMDGVAAGVAAIAAIFLGIALVQSSATGSALGAWAMAGAAIGFLRYNFKPASIFMGDAGSLFLGSLLAGLVAVSPHATSGSLVSVLFVPLAIVAVPILDTTLVTVTRTLAGRKISQGGRDHSTHRLVALGLSERGVAFLLYGFAAAGGLIALGLTRLALDAGIIAGSVFLVALSLLAAYLGRLHVEHPNEPQARGHVTFLVANLLYKKSLIKILLDVVLLSIAWYAAFRLRFDGQPPAAYEVVFQRSLGPVVALQLLTLALFGAYRGAWQYTSVVDLNRVVGGVLVSSVLILVVGHALFPPLAQSHSIVYVGMLCAAGLVLGARVSFRSLDLLLQPMRARGRRVIVYGAGAGGELAVREMRNNTKLALMPVAFLDDDRIKHGSQIHGLPVVGAFADLVPAARRFGAECVLLGMSDVSEEHLVDIRHGVEAAGLELLTLSVRMLPMLRLETPDADLARGDHLPRSAAVAGAAGIPGD